MRENDETKSLYAPDRADALPCAVRERRRGIDLKGLNLRLTVADTELSLSPKAIRQLLDANAGSLTLDMPGAEMTIPQEMLRGILKQLNGKDLEISLASGEAAMDGLSPEQKLWVPIMQERGKFLPLSVLTGEFSVGGEPLDWSKISGSLDISLTLEMPKIEKKTGWHEENGQWIYYKDDGEPMKPKDLYPFWGTNRHGFGYMVENEADKWVRRGLEPPTILPLPDLRKLGDYEDLEQDWNFPRSEDIVPRSKWIGDSLLLDFALPHFSTYLIVTRIAMPFDDVAESAWYYDAVKWAVDENITSGTDNTHFSPDAACTRAQLVTFLWRLAGEPVVNYLMPFTDVDEGAWYAEAVRWAASERIAEGTTASTFAPNAAVSRAQAVTMLWRYAKRSGVDVSVGKDTNILSYDDAFDIPAWAIEAVQWACGAQVLRGSGTALQPNDPCTRAQVAAMMSRLPGNAG